MSYFFHVHDFYLFECYKVNLWLSLLAGLFFIPETTTNILWLVLILPLFKWNLFHRQKFPTLICNCPAAHSRNFSPPQDVCHRCGCLPAVFAGWRCKLYTWAQYWRKRQPDSAGAATWFPASCSVAPTVGPGTEVRSRSIQSGRLFLNSEISAMRLVILIFHTSFTHNSVYRWFLENSFFLPSSSLHNSKSNLQFSLFLLDLL